MQGKYPPALVSATHEGNTRCAVRASFLCETLSCLRSYHAELFCFSFQQLIFSSWSLCKLVFLLYLLGCSQVRITEMPLKPGLNNKENPCLLRRKPSLGQTSGAWEQGGGLLSLSFLLGQLCPLSAFYKIAASSSGNRGSNHV